MKLSHDLKEHIFIVYTRHVEKRQKKSLKEQILAFEVFNKLGKNE
jgi:hypothetical protein